MAVMKDPVKVVQADSWDHKDLERRLCRALEVARQTIERLGSAGYTDPHESSNNVRPEKVISETALFLYAASTVTHVDEVRALSHSVAKLLIPYARSERMLLGVCLEPAVAWEYAQAHVLLSALGHKDSRFDLLLKQSASAQARDGRERPPYRMIEQEWIKRIWNRSTRSARRHSSSAANSVLAQPMDLLSGTRDDVYAFTHALMYVRDFNIRPQRLPRNKPAILAEAEAALARCLDEQDYDLGGEILLAWPLTKAAWSPAAAFGVRVLASVEDQAGFLPTAGTRLERLGTLQGEERTNYLVATAYHTVYVMGLLCAAALQHRRTALSRGPITKPRRGSANAIIKYLGGDKKTTHWRDEFDQLKDLERDAIAGLLLNIALRRKTVQREFGQVHELLRVGYRLGLADTPAASQAAEMLERLAVFANITSDKTSVPPAVAV